MIYLMNIAISFLLNTAFVWLPIILFFVFRFLYLEYKIQSYALGKLSFKHYTMLEINVPKEIYKPPQAMEFVIDVLHHLGGGAMDWKHKYWFGAILWPSSLEIVSIEGSIYFFIRVPKKLADLVKSTIYSQYPQVEVSEVDDYTKHVPNYLTNHNSWELYGVDYKLAKEDFLPIKTYIDYELDKNVGKIDENQKIDPLTPMIEFLSTLGPGEQVWIQYIIRGDAFSNWRKDAEAFVQEKMSKTGKKTDEEDISDPRLSPGEQEQVKAVQRSLSKFAFETYIRALYIAKKDKENPGVKGYFKGPIFKPFASLFHNSIKKNDDTGFDWIWEDFTGKKDLEKRKSFYADYVNREGFYRPLWNRNPVNPIILTSEELATLFHLPGSVSETNTFKRIDATKSQPPQDLPI